MTDQSAKAVATRTTGYGQDLQASNVLAALGFAPGVDTQPSGTDAYRAMQCAWHDRHLHLTTVSQHHDQYRGRPKHWTLQPPASRSPSGDSFRALVRDLVSATRLADAQTTARKISPLGLREKHRIFKSPLFWAPSVLLLVLAHSRQGPMPTVQCNTLGTTGIGT